MININFKSLEYECEKPSAKIRRKYIFPIISFGRPIEEFSNKKKPALRLNKAEDLKRVTSYFYFDHQNRYVQIDRTTKKVLSYNIDGESTDTFIDKSIKFEQHCFDSLSERKISIEEIIEAIKKGNRVKQYCMSRNKTRLYENITIVYRDLRVIASIFDDHMRIKTAYRLTEIHDKNLPEKIEVLCKKLGRDNYHNYAILNLTLLTQSLPNFSRTQIWQSITNFLLSEEKDSYSSLCANSVMQTSFDLGITKKMSQEKYNPKHEYGLMFFYENPSFESLVKRIYGLGHSASIDHSDEVVDNSGKKTIVIATSLTENCGHEWIKSSDSRNLITIDSKTCNNLTQ